MRISTLPLIALFATCGLALPALASSPVRPDVQEETPAQEEAGQDQVKAYWDLTPKEAFIEAAQQNKLSILIFLNPGEPGSDRMMRETMEDESFKKWLAENSIAVKEVAGSDSGWIKRKGIRHFPTVSIRNSSRRIVDIIHGDRTTEEWMLLLETAKRAASANTKPEGEAANDPYSWLAYGSYLFGSAGDPNEVGMAFLWCLDNSPKLDPEFYEKHLNFMLRKVVQVAKIAPNIKQGIHTRRNALHSRVVAGDCTPFDAYALSRYGMFLRDMDGSTRAFNQIKPDTKHKTLLKSILMWNNLERMVAYRRYEDILGHVPDPMQAIKARMAAIEAKNKEADAEVVSDLPRPPGVDTPAPKEDGDQEPKIKPEVPMPGVKLNNEDMAFDAALLYECLLAVRKEEDAHALMVAVTDFSPTGSTYAMFIERTNRLQRMDLGQATADRGVERVPEDQIWRIRNMIIRGTRGKAPVRR